MRRLAWLLLAATACTSAGEKNTPAAAPASNDAVPGTSMAAPVTPSALEDTTAPGTAAPVDDPGVVAKLRAEAVAKYQVRAADREKLADAYGSAIVQLALVRKNGGRVDDKVVAELWKRLKTGVCFSEPKLSIVDRTKKKPPASILEPLRSGAAAKLETTRAKCPGGKQPLILSIRLDSFEHSENAAKEKAQAANPGRSGAAPTTPFEYDADTLERTVSASGEIAIESRVFPFKVSERSRDKGHSELKLPSGVTVSADPVDVRPFTELDEAITTRILEVVQQALDRHVEGLRKAYTNMAIQTNLQDAGASQEHHALEVVALGGRLDENQALAAKLAERYELPASELAVAVTALHLD